MIRKILPDLDKQTGRLLFIIIFIGLILRIALALVSDNFNHPDEHFQILEQAHRLVFGYGLIPWEYQFDARSWLIPGLVAGLLYPFKLFGLDNPNIYIPGMKIILCLISVISSIAVFNIARKLHSARAGLIAVAYYSLWYDTIYFSIKPLSEVWATLFFLIALAILIDTRSKKMIALSIFLAVLVSAIRINYIPLTIVLIIRLLLYEGKSIKPLVLITTLLSVAFVAVFEWVTVGGPFMTYYNFYTINKSFFMTGSVGTSISFEYLLFLGYSSLFIFWLILLSGLIKWKENKFLMSLIIVGLLSHILIPAQKHQIDFRHIYILIPLILILGGIQIAKSLGNLKAQTVYAVTIIMLFTVVSVFGALGKLPLEKKIYSSKTLKVHNDTIFKNYDNLKAYLYLYSRPDLHGIYDNTDLWFKSGGYYYLHRDVPIYFYTKKAPSPNFVSHFITKDKDRYIPGFEFLASFGDIQIYNRIDKEFVYPVDTSYNNFIFQPGVNDLERN